MSPFVWIFIDKEQRRPKATYQRCLQHGKSAPVFYHNKTQMYLFKENHVELIPVETVESSFNTSQLTFFQKALHAHY